MPLQSKLLSGDPKLEACLVSDPAHVTPGSRGDHVKKIQIALNQLSNAGLDEDGIYGPATSKAVTDYKNHPSRRILQPYQTTADEIVGKRTIASLDSELLAKESAPSGAFDIVVLRPTPRAPVYSRSSFTPIVAFAIPFQLVDAQLGVTVIDPPKPVKSIRLKPRETAEFLLKNPGSHGGAFIQCVNSPAAKGDCKDRIAWLWTPGDADRLAPEPTGKAAVVDATTPASFGNNRMFLVKGDQKVSLDGFNVGDAVLSATSDAGKTVSVQVMVRAVSAGPTPRAALTKFTAGSKFFSAERDEGGEPDPHNVFGGRPVSPQRGGRLINLGGEQETPEFEDYQVSLGFSGYARTFTSDKFVFRPLVDDPDPSVGIAPKSASHICMRGSPFTDEFSAAIKSIAQAGCIFTMSNGHKPHRDKAKAVLGGTVLEDDDKKGNLAIRL